MSEEEMLKFANEQLEIFGKKSDMAIFLRSVIDYIENTPKMTFNVSGNNSTFIDYAKSVVIK